jgi:acyl carrier protein
MTTSTTTADAIADIWRELFGQRDIRPDDDFFDLGGHSVTATRLTARLRSRLRVDLPATAVFQARTPAELAALVDAAPELPPGPARRAASVALSAQQRQQWLLQSLAGEHPSYHIPLTMRIRGALDTSALRAALSDLVRWHEILRTRYVVRDGEPVAVLDPADRFAVGMVRVLAGRLDTALATEVHRPFDLATQPPFRATLCRVSRQDHVLVAVVHHIAADGWSRNLILADLAARYAFHRGLGSAPEDPPVQYADVADGERTGAEPAALMWWRERLTGVPAHTTFPGDRARPAELTDAGAELPLILNAELSDRVRTLAGATGTTPYTVLMAALQLLLSRHSGETDVVVATSVAGRTELAQEQAIGCFVNTIAIRTDVSGGPTVTELLDRVRIATTGALARAATPFELIVRELALPREPGWRPVFQVMLTVHNEPPVYVSLANLDTEWVETPTNTAKCDVFVAVVDDGGPLHGTLAYRSQLYNATTASRLAAEYVSVLAAFTEGEGRSIDDICLVSPTS